MIRYGNSYFSTGAIAVAILLLIMTFVFIFADYLFVIIQSKKKKTPIADLKLMTFNKALFPISIDSKRFNTIETINAINKIEKYYDEIIFLIADEIQIYNKS